MNNHFLFRVKPFIYESLTSYILRIAEGNFVSPYDVWRIALPLGIDKPYYRTALILDMNPSKVLDVRLLESMLLMSKNELDILSISTVMRKLVIEEEDFNNCFILDGLTNKFRKYCPLCLKEQPYYKLHWQISEIEWCEIHNIRLLGHCWSCRKNIPIITSHSILKTCPICGVDLSQANCNLEHIENNFIRIIEDWTALLYSDYSLKLVEELTPKQSLAIKLLYLINMNGNSYRYDRVTNYLKQIARKTKKLNTYISISTIFKIIRSFNVTTKEFLELKIPSCFVEEIIIRK